MTKLHLFDAYGIELEYMIVNKNTLSVMPICDKILYSVAGEYLSEIAMGKIQWSNELALHVIEMKTNGPAADLTLLPSLFNQNIEKINRILENYEAVLLPTGMHPFMDPIAETKLWPHEYNEVYETYNKIFDCKGHAWSNLQSTHINLPFCGDDEFARLHAAVRLLLPIIPALSASSPIAEGEVTSVADTRLELYRNNQKKIPFITGLIIPEQAFSRQDYEDLILKPMYCEISPYDPNKIVRFEWLNSRGAIARFMRNSIEIRLIDVQECPLADIAIAVAVTEIIKKLVYEESASFEIQKNWHEKRLSDILLQVIKRAETTVINDNEYLSLFGCRKTSCTAGELWSHIFDNIKKLPVFEKNPEIKSAFETIIRYGPLSSRMIKFLRHDTSKDRIIILYKNLAQCLKNNKLFTI